MENIHSSVWVPLVQASLKNLQTEFGKRLRTETSKYVFHPPPSFHPPSPASLSVIEVRLSEVYFSTHIHTDCNTFRSFSILKPLLQAGEDGLQTKSLNMSRTTCTQTQAVCFRLLILQFLRDWHAAQCH